jgi:hypothetical protein
MRFSRQRVMAVVWDVAPYSLVEIDRRFGGACCLHHQGDGYSSYWWWSLHGVTAQKAVTCKIIFIRQLLVKTPIPYLLKIRSVVKIWSMWTISWFCVHLCTLETTHQNVFNGISYLGEGCLRLYVNIRILDKYRSFGLLNKTSTVRFQVLMAASMKMTAFGV